MKKLFIATLAACLMASTAVYADAISDRKAAMKNVGGAMKAMVGMVKGKTEYDQRVAALALGVIDNALIGFPELFPAGTETGGESIASPKIFSDMNGFKAAIAKTREDIAAVTAFMPEDVDTFRAEFGKVAGNCKSCHENYRIPKDK